MSILSCHVNITSFQEKPLWYFDIVVKIIKVGSLSLGSPYPGMEGGNIFFILIIKAKKDFHYSFFFKLFFMDFSLEEEEEFEIHFEVDDPYLEVPRRETHWRFHTLLRPTEGCDSLKLESGERVITLVPTTNLPFFTFNDVLNYKYLRW